MEPTSPEPFASYPYAGRRRLGYVRGANCRHEYGLRHQQVTGQNACAYCEMSLVDTYEHWLLMAYDHVVPASVCAAASIAAEWKDDFINRVLCCAACNGFKNRYKPTEATCPASLEEFVALRDCVFLERKELILRSHQVERAFYERKPWEQRIEV